ncbi:MAG: phosphoribosylformylglycinamidine cyclo-ligase [Candidatus Omnitrophica bacterium]|nr:phosphoribosylformylglycinamidine cyclo-ligase [Candidatus Omnitrophota bacterium]
MTNKRVTYKSSGVDITKANEFVDSIKSDVKKTLTSAVLKREGSFGALYELSKGSYKKPVLVSSTDGVGTKLLLAQQFGVHDTVGIDLVAMNVNDILCVGAKPLFFLDYIACGKLDPKILKQVVKGIADGCRQSGSSLIGGETAEMPGMYKPNEYDLAGFSVGIVEKDNIIDGSTIKRSDVVIGFPSSGIHSNGYSMVRKALSAAQIKANIKELLTPTRIYTPEVALMTSKFKVRGIAHITGGAYYEKLTRILPAGKCFLINKGSWPVPKIFQILQKNGRIEDKEMYRTFNMGIGLAMVIRSKDWKPAHALLKQKKIQHYLIGEVDHSPDKKILFTKGEI